MKTNTTCGQESEKRKRIGLPDYYRDIQAWIDSDFSDSFGYSQTRGLCENILQFVAPIDHYALQEELLSSFEDAGLHKYYPFGYQAIRKWEIDPYSPFYAQQEVHLRLEWVRNQLLSVKEN